VFKALKDTMLGRGRRDRTGTAGHGSGQQAENLAAAFLERQGVRLIARNYRCRGGEIDLIGLHHDTLLLVEVRLRRRSDFGDAAASITRAKQRRIVLAARHFLAAHPQWQTQPCRFDCLLLDQLSPEHIDWLPDAFHAEEG
jgi:putative endonuclease